MCTSLWQYYLTISEWDRTGGVSLKMFSELKSLYFCVKKISRVMGVLKLAVI